MSEDGLWVQSDVAADGHYVATVNAGGRAWALSHDEARAYAAAVVRACAEAEHDAAVVRMLAALGLDREAGGLLVGELREDRAGADTAATAPLTFTPGVSAFTGEAFLHLALDGQGHGQLDPAAAREHALYVLETPAVADLDRSLFVKLTDGLGLDEARARAAVARLGEHRRPGRE